ncbi:MAG: polysaccharide biosynthesis tyrosine autokinase [Jaaginema sp. PMC 1080.18]|nr:polysaccharide biosynthesis tyrosine autokinase [Jaaginema sp. PMC 1080.18]MEC4867508.1 polysaccharide biosynthesis tyrosine autokinase [Jaaginema sp. PMC 1078.18]
MAFNANSQPPFPNSNGKNPPPKTPLDSPSFTKDEDETLNLRAVLSIARRRWLLLIAVTVAVSAVVGGRVLNEEPRYQSQFRLLVEPIASEEQFDQFSQRLAGQSGIILDYDTQIQVLLSPTVLNPIVEKIQERYPEVDYGYLVGNLGVYRVDTTKILEISFTDTDPDRIKYVLDQLAIELIRYSQREQKTGKQKGLEFVEDQLPVLQQRVDRLQAQVEAFRQANNLIEPEVQSKSVSDRLMNIKQEQQNNRARLSEANSLYESLQRQLDLELGEAMTVAALSEAPRYQALLNELQKIETEIAIETARFTPNSPQVQALANKRNKLLPLLSQEANAVLGTNSVSDSTEALAASPNPIRLQLTQDLIKATNERQIYQVRDRALTQAEAETKASIQEMATVTRRYTDLERQLEVATESLNRFLAVQEDLQIEAAQRTMSWEILVQPGRPFLPISPNVPRGLLIGLVAGLLAGAGAALLAEKLDARFHSVEDLKESVRLPILGIIPHRKDFKERRGDERATPVLPMMRRYRASPFLEAFRSLNTNLAFLNPDTPLQTLVISSSMPLEGKSTTSLHLAQAAAAMGQKVLLVDADLRRPQIHAMIDLPNVWGLSHAISTDLEINDIIQRSPTENNLYILTAGQIPPDPTRLLSSQKMRSLIAKFRESFDLVIFDTPPLLGLADGKFLAAHTDGMLLVVRLGRTERTIFKQVLDNIKVSQSSALGLIANGAKDYTSSSYSYYHRYFSEDDSESPHENSVKPSR